ncbi:NADPH-dependent oxidoreductase [bacterium]|nr:MAG: NADPH-dependent oxidoreductase [bacterium]RIK64428.1 MAG: NADPH-dependent FMN reductase [Planctomycetota bacterium]
MKTARILAFSASLRKESLNAKLVRVAAKAAEAEGAVVTLIHLRDYPLPVYDGDVEAATGLPENAVKLKALFKEHQGLLVASPEYNGSYPGGFKNMLDWLSRSAPGERPFAALEGKTAAIMAASPGAFGGMRLLPLLRLLLSGMRVLVLPDQLALPKAHEAFQEDGSLRDPKIAGSVEALGKLLARTCTKLAE